MPTLIALITLILPWMAAVPAYALSCDIPLGAEALPSQGTAAPRNTRVWIPVYGDSAYEYRWHDTDGADVAFDVQRLSLPGGFDLDVLSARGPLRFPATYQVEACIQGDGQENCFTPTKFSTLDEIDEEPPAPPQVDEWMRDASDGDYGKQRIVFFSVQGDTLVVADADGKGLDSPLDDEGAQLAVVTVRSQPGIGYGPCTPRNIEGDRADVRFGTFDLAGNFSGFTEPQRVKLPELDGCALSTRPGGGWAALLVAVALLHRRTRRQARA